MVANDVDSLAGIIVTGMPGEPLCNITLSNIQLQFRGGGRAELAKREYRPAAMLVDVKNESITNLKADLQKGAKLIVKKK